jgi:gas vesicle protein
MGSGKTFKRLAVGTLIAGAAGYVAGILTAPKSGKETRADIKQTADKTIAEAEKQLKNAHTELNELINTAKKQGKDLSGKGKAQLDDVTDKANDVKEKLRELISAVREGEADDKELKRAMQDAKHSVDHLKKYLKK